MDERISTVISRTEHTKGDLRSLRLNTTPEKALLIDRAGKRLEDFYEDMQQIKKLFEKGLDNG